MPLRKPKKALPAFRRLIHWTDIGRQDGPERVRDEFEDNF